MYNYYESVLEDVKEHIRENYTKEEIKEGLDESKIYDDCWIDDSVTGNASGSYTFNTYQAEENICHNWDLLNEALQEFGCEDVDITEKGAEWADVTIRCYMLGQVINKAIKETEEEIEEGEINE